jgi:hypothetical protein
MPALLSPRNLDYRPEHERSASWFATICKIFSHPKLDLTCHLQNDGSQIFKYAEEYGRNFTYIVQVWPNGDMRGYREVKNSE